MFPLTLRNNSSVASIGDLRRDFVEVLLHQHRVHLNPIVHGFVGELNA